MGWKTFARKIWTEISEDAVFTWSSALAYAWIFAVFPLGIFLLSLAPYLPGQTKDNLLDRITPAIQQAVGGDLAKELTNSIQNVMDNTQGGLLSFGLILTLWSASGGMSVTMSALDKAYEVTNERSFVKHRLVAIALTVAVVLLILFAVVLIPVGGAIVNYFRNTGALGTAAVVVVNILRYAIAVGVLLASVSLIYYFGPNIKQKWQTVSPGAVMAVVVWLLAGWGFSYYVSNFGNFNKTYGTLGAAVALLLFFYLSSIIILVGAEVNSVIDFAVLKVKPGTRDFTKVCEDESAETDPAKERAEGRQHRKDAISSPSSGDDKAVRDVKQQAASGDRPAPIPVGKAQDGWWKWAAAASLLGWVADRPKKQPARRTTRPA